jgi:hypothetical protein
MSPTDPEAPPSDDQLEPGWLLDRQIGRLGAFENLPDVNADLAIVSQEARSIADQAADRGELAPFIDRRNGMACRQHHELVAPAEEERFGGDDERAGMQLNERREGGVDLAFGAGLQDTEPHSTINRTPSAAGRPCGLPGYPWAGLGS